MKNKIKFIIITVTIILIINLFLVYKMSISENIYDSGMKSLKEAETISYIPIENQIEIKQSFVGKYKNLSSITVRFSELKQEKNNKEDAAITLGILDVQTNEVLAEETVLSNHLRVFKDYQLEFKKQENSQGKEYIIYIKYTSKENSQYCYTVDYYKEDAYKQGALSINGQDMQTDLVFQDFYINQDKVVILTILCVTISILEFAIAFSIYRDRNIKPEKILLKLLPVFAIMMCFAITMGNGKDESSHWYRAYEISEGVLTTRVYNGKDIRSETPKSMYDINSYRKLPYNEFIQLFGNTIQGDKVYINIASSAVYSPVQYLPQSLGMALSRIVTNDPLIIAYVGRICNLIACVAILYMTIKITPIGKNVFLLLSILPITVSSIATLSADGLTTSMCFLFIAYILHLAYDKQVKVGKRQVVSLSLITIFVALCKIVYLPLIGLLLIIPKEKFKDKKDKIMTIILIWSIGIIISFVWLIIAGKTLSLDRSGDSVIKLMTILENPFHYIQVILYTIPNQIESYINSMFGGSIEYDEQLVLYITPYVLMFLSIAASLADENIKKIQMSKFQKVIIILIILAILFLIFTSLYLQWTEYGLNYIKGVQGRYFIPFLPLVFILLGKIKFTSQYSNETITKTIGITGAIMQIYVLISIILLYI